MPPGSPGQAIGARSHRKLGSLLITLISPEWFPKETGCRNPEKKGGGRHKDTEVPQVWFSFKTLLKRASSPQPCLRLHPAFPVLPESQGTRAAPWDQPQPPLVRHNHKGCLQNKQGLSEPSVLKGGVQVSPESLLEMWSLPHFQSPEPQTFILASSWGMCRQGLKQRKTGSWSAGRTQCREGFCK